MVPLGSNGVLSFDFWDGVGGGLGACIMINKSLIFLKNLYKQNWPKMWKYNNALPVVSVIEIDILGIQTFQRILIFKGDFFVQRPINKSNTVN